MNIYSFKNVNNIYVIGNCQNDFKNFLREIKSNINVNSEDEDKPHPKEIERMARKKAREEASRNIIQAATQRMRMPRYEDFRQAMSSIDNSVFKQYKKPKKSPFSNSLFIITGDCGLGFNNKKYYEKILDDYNKVYAYNNTYVVMIRGNHDDPSYFDGIQINYSNIKAVPDYSVLNINDDNILCVGGAISIDRTWRLKQEEIIKNFSKTNSKTIYWKNEAPVFNQKALDEIVKEVKIDYVVSHTAPSFVNPENHNCIDEWSENDSTLINDIKEERKVLDRVFEFLRDNDMKPKYWAYGHFGYAFIEKRSDTLFRSLCEGFNPISIKFDIAQFIKEEENRKKKKKIIGLKTINLQDSNEANFIDEPMVVEQEANENDEYADGDNAVGERIGEPIDNGGIFAYNDARIRPFEITPDDIRRYNNAAYNFINEAPILNTADATVTLTNNI